MAAYLIVNYNVTDPDKYKEYQQGAAPIMKGGKLLVLDGKSNAIEGEPGAQTVVIEYPDMETAEAAYNSEDYKKVVGLRHDATSDGIAVLVNGMG